MAFKCSNENDLSVGHFYYVYSVFKIPFRISLVSQSKRIEIGLLSVASVWLELSFDKILYPSLSLSLFFLVRDSKLREYNSRMMLRSLLTLSILRHIFINYFHKTSLIEPFQYTLNECTRCE